MKIRRLFATCGFFTRYFFVAFWWVFSWLFRGPLLSRKTVFGPFSLLFRGFFVALILGKFYAYSPWKSLLRSKVVAPRGRPLKSSSRPLEGTAKVFRSYCLVVPDSSEPWEEEEESRVETFIIAFAAQCEIPPPYRAIPFRDSIVEGGTAPILPCSFCLETGRGGGHNPYPLN